jgi:uncharacterized protein (DUF58 family)
MTRIGVGAAVLGAVLVALGWLLVWPPLVVLGAGILILVLAALGYVVRRPRLVIERQIQPPRVTKGLPAIAYLNFSNQGRNPVPAIVASQPYGSSSVRIVLPRLLRGQSGVRVYRLPTSRRGIFDIGPVEITRSDPFDFVRVTQHHAGNDQIWVYPQVFPFRPLPSGITRHLEGPSSDTAPEGSITFHRLREYVVGDDLRMIHWKSTARTGQLMVRHNVDTSQPYTVVLVDVRPAVYSAETFETAVDAAASAISCSASGKSPVQVRTTSGQQVGGPSQGDVITLLDFLTGIEPDASGSIGRDCLRLRRERGGTGLVVVTGALDTADLPAIAGLRRRFQRIVVVSVTTVPMPPLQFPGVTIITGTSGEEITNAWNLEVSG